MSKLPLNHFVLPLALALALAGSPVAAQQITTSHGVRMLPRIQGVTEAPQLRQALVSTEQILDELLQDIDALDRSRSATAGQGTALTETVKRTNLELERAKAAFDQADQRYRDDLAAFGQRQAAQEADVQAQIAQGAALEALPSAQRDINEVLRINEWAAKIGKEREALEAERNRLLADHDRVETERAALAKQRADAEAKLKNSRDGVVGQFGGIEDKRKIAYQQLRTTVHHAEVLRAQLSQVLAGKAPPSPVFDMASAKLRAWESSRHN